jgi:hypothetical protein
MTSGQFKIEEEKLLVPFVAVNSIIANAKISFLTTMNVSFSNSFCVCLFLVMSHLFRQIQLATYARKESLDESHTRSAKITNLTFPHSSFLFSSWFDWVATKRQRQDAFTRSRRK